MSRKYRREWVSKGQFYSADQTRSWAQRRQAKGVASRRNRPGLDERDRAILADHTEGMSQRAIARKHNLTQARISQVISLLHRW